MINQKYLVVMDKINDDEADMLPRLSYRDKEKEDKIVAEALFGKTTQTYNMKKNENLTNLVDKHHSPMVVRKFTKWGFPVYIGIISDNDIDDFDQFIVTYIEDRKSVLKEDSLQKLRNLAGDLTEALTEHYNKTEGVAVVFYWDKCFISSLFGDLMTHAACKQEFYFLLNMSTGV